MRLSSDMLRWLGPDCPEEVIRILESPGLHHVTVKDGQYWIDGKLIESTVVIVRDDRPPAKTT